MGLSLALTMVPLPVWAQGLSEFGGIHAGAAGMGAGLAASQHNGALVRNTYGAAVRAQESLVTQNQAIEQYLALGLAFEAKKQWVNAEGAFTNALKWICNRDGPGSEASVPALQHLAKVTKAQNKLDQAIGYQKTVVAFARKIHVPDTRALLGADRELSDMFVQKGDYANAEPVLQEAVALMDRSPHVTSEQHNATLRVYGRVLRELNKIAEADAIDASLAANATPAVGAPVVSAVATPAIAPTQMPDAAAVAPVIVPVTVSAPSQAATAAAVVSVPTQANAQAQAPSVPLVSAPSSANIAPTEMPPTPAATATSAAPTPPDPTAKADLPAVSVDETVKDKSAVSSSAQTPTSATDEKPGEKTTLPEVDKNSPATTDEKPMPSGATQPGVDSSVQSKTSDQSTQQANKAN
jgi:hypothetical protein